jgi:hypothetical protein
MTVTNGWSSAPAASVVSELDSTVGAGSAGGISSNRGVASGKVDSSNYSNERSALKV